MPAGRRSRRGERGRREFPMIATVARAIPISFSRGRSRSRPSSMSNAQGVTCPPGLPSPRGYAAGRRPVWLERRRCPRDDRSAQASVCAMLRLDDVCRSRVTIARLQPRTRMRERLLLAIFVGGAVGALLRAGLEEAFPAVRARLAVGDVRRERRGRCLLGVFRHAAAGAIAAVDVSSTLSRYRLLRRAHDVLDVAGRGDHARAGTTTPTWCRVPRRQRRGRTRRGAGRHRARAQGEDAVMGGLSDLWGVGIFGGVGAVARFRLDGVVQGAVGRRVSVRDARRQRAGLAVARAVDRIASRASDCCWPGRRCSARSRRSRRGCSRRNGSPRKARGLALANVVAASRSASAPPLSAGRSGLRCDVRLPEADGLLRGA